MKKATGIFTAPFKNVQVIVRPGHMDIISITFDCLTPFPELKYEAVATVQARCGYGIEWCRQVLGVEPEVFNSI